MCDKLAETISTEDTMNFSRAFRYIFDDKDWVTKTALGVLIMLVPILNFAWLGYQIQIMRNVWKNETIILPAWGEDLGKRFMDGLMLALAGIVYALPVFLVVGLPTAIMVIPALLVEDPDVMGALMTGSMFVNFCLMCVFFLYALVLSFFTPVMHMFYAREGTFASCFKFGEIFRTITQNAGPFFTVWLVNFGVSMGVSMAVGAVGGILGWIPILGQLLLMVLGIAGPMYALYFSAHTYGQFMSQVFGNEG